MGKKVKKDEKGPPDDVFDTLLVESRQAGTVVLMLNSPEEEVISKACEAIYKFVDKAEENKKLLLDLGAVEALLPLIQHEERIIRRNACMALGTMTAHPEVRRSLRKKGDSIQCFVNLLNPEEDTVVHEFAALGLSSMAAEFSSKITIYEQNGLEPLIGCLSSHDPDVQKNSIETITLLLQDYQSKAAIRELGGFPPILDLLKSDYAVIQQLALTALHLASEDVDNRAALRELEAINRLIDFIGHPEWNDLHVYAVMVISNCLEDVESVEMIKDNGGLMKLVAYITDTTPPEDEDPKKGGKKEKAASRAGKKGKDDESARATPKITDSDYDEPSTDDKKGAKGGGGGGGGGGDDGVTPTLPEVKEHAAKAIARSARNADNRKLLHEQEVEKMLIHLLSHEDCNVQVAAAQGLAMMAESMISRDSIGQWDGLEALMKMIRSDNPDIKEASTLALANLTTSNSHNCSEILRLKGVEPLIDILSDSHERIVSNAAMILTNMSPDEQLRSEIQRLGVITALIEPLQSTSTLVQSKCALAAAAFVCDIESRTLFRESGGIQPLVALLSTGNDDTRRSASWAITVCAADQPTATEICKYGGMEALREIQLSSTRKNAFTDVALNKILGNNLSAKYSLNGNLSACDIITDGFFDAGQLNPGATLLTLEEHCALDLNQRRPIILINAQPEKPGTPEPSEDPKDATGKGRNSRVTRKSRAKSDKETKDEEAAKEEEGPSEVIFTPPGDANLMKYIEDVTEKIQPLPTSRDQVSAVAQFVVDRMGGPIDRGQVSNFSWELGISQLKYDLKSNVIPIGAIKAGIHYHRALLFKVLCDKIAVGCSLVRGEYNRAWNVVMLTNDDDTPGAPKFPASQYIVDLIHQPGRLIKLDSPEAVNYQKL